MKGRFIAIITIMACLAGPTKQIGGSCALGKFKCKINGRCIYERYVCDRQIDCIDSSDEENCPSSALYPDQCTNDQFKCFQGSCVPLGALCNASQNCPDESDEFNCPGTQPQRSWKERWFGHQEVLTLVSSDENVVLYSDATQNVTNSVQWSFEILSKAWKYVTETFGPFGPDPRLYVILHSDKNSSCLMSSYVDSKHGPRNLVDCGHPERNGWAQNTPENSLNLLTTFGQIIMSGASGVSQDADFNICGESLQDILSYDVYTHFYGNDDKIRFWGLERMLVTYMGRACFKEWFLPIYKKHGGRDVLLFFFNLTATYAEKQRMQGHGNRDQFKQFTIEEFIHFWSGAVKTDLSGLAKTAFNWTSANENQAAKMKYPGFNYAMAEEFDRAGRSLKNDTKASYSLSATESPVQSSSVSEGYMSNEVIAIICGVIASVIIATVIFIGVKRRMSKKRSRTDSNVATEFNIGPRQSFRMSTGEELQFNDAELRVYSTLSTTPSAQAQA